MLVKKVNNYLSLVKFAHTLFALPFALSGFALAVKDERYDFSWLSLILVLLCMVFARSAAMGFNRYLDREIDRRNPRTMNREIPAGVIRERSALFFTLLMSAGFIATTWFINSLCFYLSPVALFVILGYSFTKRFTAFSHMVLGLGLSLAPIGAYLAVSGTFDLIPVLLSVSVLLWTAGFDIIYALQDEEFDKENRLRSLPVMLGKKGALQFSSLIHLVSVAILIWMGFSGIFGLFFWIGLVVFAALVLYQHLLVKPDDLRRVNVAFFTLNGIASVVFAVFFILDTLQ